MASYYQKFQEHLDQDPENDSKTQPLSPEPPLPKEEVLIEHMQEQKASEPESEKKEICEKEENLETNQKDSVENKENIENNEKNGQNPKNHLQMEKVRSSDNFLNEGHNKYTSSKNNSLSNSLPLYRLKPHQVSENDKNFTHTEIFHQACLERKKNCFHSLKNWDLKRARFLTMHRNILETIQDRLTSHVRTSQKFMSSLTKYLKDRATQELNYANQNVEEFVFDENQKNDGFQLYGKFLENLDDSAEKHREHCKKVGDLGLLIEEKLLEGNLLPEMHHYNKIIKEFNENLLRIKKNLTKLNIDASEKSAKFSTLYFTMINAPFGKKTEKDLYRREISFLRVANEQVKFQRKLAIEVFSFWDSLKELEIRRVEISRKAIDDYLDEFRKVYPFLELNITILAEQFKELTIDELEMKEILNEEERGNIVTQARDFKINFEELSSEVLKEFFEGFVIKPLGNEVLLVIKEIKAMRNIGGILSTYADCKLILTVDGFFISFDYPIEENEFKKPSMIVNLETTTSIKTKDIFYLEITRTKPGFLMNSMERFVFKFVVKEELEELLEYLNRYYSKK